MKIFCKKNSSTVILECTNCAFRNDANKESKRVGISRYITQKNRHNTPRRLEWESQSQKEDSSLFSLIQNHA